MKKNNIKTLIAFILTAISFTGIGACAATQYLAKDVNFTSTHDNFKATNVEEALDELYSDSSLKIGTPTYQHYLGVTGTHEEQVTLSKGKYLVFVLYEYQMANPMSQITESNNTAQLTGNLICESNNCYTKQINGYLYHPVATTSAFSNNYYIHSAAETYLFELEIFEETDTISTKLSLTWGTPGLAETVAIQAYPINKLSN